MVLFKNVWLYRYFILSSIRNEVVSRFGRSKLGGLWMILNPLAQVSIYALILSNVLSAKLPGIDNKFAYAIYLMAGLLAWSLFNEIIVRCLNIFIENGNLIKKMQFPRIALPIIVLGSNVLNNIILFFSIMFIFFLLEHGISLVILWVLPLTLLLSGFSLGIGLLLGIFNVFIRDLGQVVPILLQILFWFTPIVYPQKIIPIPYHDLLSFNPIYHFTKAYQDILVYNRAPELKAFLILSVLAGLILLLSLFVYRRSSEEIVDSI